MSAQEGQEFRFHAACYDVVVALIAAWLLEALLVADAEQLFELVGGEVRYAPLSGLINRAIRTQKWMGLELTA